MLNKRGDFGNDEIVNTGPEKNSEYVQFAPIRFYLHNTKRSRDRLFTLFVCLSVCLSVLGFL